MSTQEDLEDARNGIEEAIKLAVMVIDQVQEDVTNTLGMLNAAKGILETLQLCREIASSKYDRERSNFATFDQALISGITSELQLCIETRNGTHKRMKHESGVSKWLAFMNRSQKKAPTRKIDVKHLERARKMAEEIYSKSFASISEDNKNPEAGDNSHSLLQLLKEVYLKGKVIIDDNIYARGGSADIRRGTWWVDGKPRQISVKTFRTRRDDRLFDKRIAREFQIFASLHHANVLEFLGVHLMNTGGDQARLGIVTPFCENGASNAYFSLRKFSNHDRLDFLRKSADAIAFLHDNSIVHGDLKPVRTGEILVQYLSHGRWKSGDLRFWVTGLTSGTGVLAGTVRYMPPETIRADDEFRNAQNCLTFASDVWSFGMTVLELMSGHIPYYRTSLDVAVLALLYKGESPPREDNETVPELVWAIIARCWALEPVTRPSMLEVKRAMDAAWSEGDLGPPYISDRTTPPSPDGKLVSAPSTIPNVASIPDSERNSESSLSSSFPQVNQGQ